MRTIVGLGLRAALPRASSGRFVALVIVGGVACASFLIVVMATAVKEREADRHHRHEREAPLTEVAAVHTVTVASYRGRLLTLVQVVDGADPAWLPPGLGTSLPPGQVRFSPALAERVDRDPVLARWFPYDRGDVLPIESVKAAGEYKAYIGVAPGTEPPGIAEDSVFSYRPDFLPFQRVGFVVFVAVPALGLLTMAGRFGRRARRERLAALRLLGMPSLSCRAVLAIETGLPIAAGAVAVGGAALAVRPHHVVLPVVDRWVFGQDAQLGPATVLVVAGTVGLLGALVGATTRREQATGRLRGLVARADPIRRWSLGIYALGVAVIGWAYVRAQPGDPLRFWGIAVAGAGIMGAVTHLTARVARLLRWESGPTAWFIAMRKLSVDPRSHTRLAGIAGIVAFVIAVSQPAAQLLAEPSTTWVSHARAAGASTVAGWSWAVSGTPVSLPDARPPGIMVALPEIALWSPGADPHARPDRRALVASCVELETLVGGPVRSCNDGVQAVQLGDLIGSSSDLPAGPLEVRGVDGRAVARLEQPRSVVTVPYDDTTLSNPATGGPSFPPLLVPPGRVPDASSVFVSGVRLRVEADVEAWEATKAWFMGSNPSAHLENQFENLESADTTFSWLLLGFGFVAGLALLGAGLTITDEQRTVGEWFALRALGAGTWHLVWIRLLTAIVSSLVAVAVAIVPAVLVTLAYLKVVGDDLPSFAAYYVAATVTVSTVVVGTAGSALLQARKGTKVVT